MTTRDEKIESAYTVGDYLTVINDNISKAELDQTIPGVSFRSNPLKVPLMITGFETIAMEERFATKPIELTALKTEIVDASSSDQTLQALSQQTLIDLFNQHHISNDSLLMVEMPITNDGDDIVDTGVISINGKDVRMATPQNLKLSRPESVSQDQPILAFIEI